MQQFNVKGMSCAACVARVEKAVNNCEGVSNCAVSLLTNSMAVEGGNINEIIQAVSKAGYEATLKNNNSINQNNDIDTMHESKHLLKRLVVSIILLLLLMYVSMGMMLNLPYPSFLYHNPLSRSLSQMILAAIIMIINNRFFTNGFKGLINLAPNMDTLVALGSMSSFVYSVVMTFLISESILQNNIAQANTYASNLYFESAAMIVTLITIGKMLEANAKGKTTNALKDLMNLAPTKATILVDSQEIEVDINNIKVDDIFVVKAGESIPADGIIIEGSAAIDEAFLTGESLPVDKEVGDEIAAATINLNGFIKARVKAVKQDTTIAKIIEMMNEVSTTKAPIAKIADQVAGIFVPVVMGISLISFIIWLLLGESFAFALNKAICVLVISCPCSLGLATPVAIMVGNGVGAKNGILFKNAKALEQVGQSQIVVLDKTGTITKGTPTVSDLICFDINEQELLTYAYSLEKQSNHPLAKAINSKAASLNIESLALTDFKELAGNGLTAIINNKQVLIGSYKFLKTKINIKNKQLQVIEDLANQGKTPILLSIENKLAGIIAIMDTIKDDAINAIYQLNNMGIKTIMLTGDHQKTANAIGKQVGVNKVIANVLPDQKAIIINRLKEYGKVMMVGDGINDAVALVSADIGMAIKSGSDIAIEAADVVIMKSNLTDIVAAIRLSKQTLVNIYENLFWAFFYNSLMIPVAAGLFSKLSININPMIGAACMSLSSFCVVSNALRLNLFNIYDQSKDHKIKNEILKEIKIMESNFVKTLTVKGMMCHHCEARCVKELEKVDGVDSAVANHETDSVVVNCAIDVDCALLQAAVEEAGYEFIECK